MNGISPSLDGLLQGLVTANHILANEGVLDGLGHVSARHPKNPERFLISRSRSPALVERDDIRLFDLDSQPVHGDVAGNYAERVIHGCIYRARPEVMAVCHFHAAPILPFANTGAKLQPVLHVGAVIGREVPVWDARDEFGNTDLLVSTLDQGHSLAPRAWRELGRSDAPTWRGHGGPLVAGGSVPLHCSDHQRRGAVSHPGAGRPQPAHGRGDRAFGRRQPEAERAPAFVGLLVLAPARCEDRRATRHIRHADIMPAINRPKGTPCLTS